MRKTIKTGTLCAVPLFIICLLAGVASAAPTATAKITWTANTEDDLFGYNVYMGTAPGVYDAVVFVEAPLTEHVFDDLQDKKTYYFCVTAVDTTGNESLKSQEVFKIIKDITPPAIPTGVVVE